MRNATSEKGIAGRASATPAVLEDAWRRFLVDRDLSARETILAQFAPLVRHVVGRMSVVLVF